MKEELEIKVNQKSVYSNEISELDLDTGYDFCTAKERKEYEWFPIDIKEENISETEGYPIKIDRLITLLQCAKEVGANYVIVDYDGDHYGYIVEGLKLTRK